MENTRSIGMRNSECDSGHSNPRSDRFDRFLELFDPRSRFRRNGHQGTIGQERSVQQIFDLCADQLNKVRLDQIGFCDRHHAGSNAKQIHDLQMLARLRHHPVIGGDNQQRQIYAGRAGDHVFHESFVTRHVDHAELEFVTFPMRKAEVDGDATRFFFRQTIGFDSGQLPD